MTYPNLIAIGGLKNCGKDTVSEMIQYLLNSPKILHKYRYYKLLKNLFKRKYTVISFASKLKQTLSTLLDIPVKQFNNRNFKENFYIYFPTLDLTDNPPKDKVISDNKFVKFINKNDFTFIQDYYITIRQLMQYFGTSVMRGFFGDKLWILLTLKNNKSIISDLRFKVEYNEIKVKNGYTIYVSRPGTIQGNHASEKEVVELYKDECFDTIIINNGSLEDLFNKCKNIVYSWQRKI